MHLANTLRLEVSICDGRVSGLRTDVGPRPGGKQLPSILALLRRSQLEVCRCHVGSCRIRYHGRTRDCRQRLIARLAGDGLGCAVTLIGPAHQHQKLIPGSRLLRAAPIRCSHGVCHLKLHSRRLPSVEWTCTAPIQRRRVGITYLSS